MILVFRILITGYGYKTRNLSIGIPMLRDGEFHEDPHKTSIFWIQKVLSLEMIDPSFQILIICIHMFKTGHRDPDDQKILDPESMPEFLDPKSQKEQPTSERYVISLRKECHSLTLMVSVSGIPLTIKYLKVSPDKIFCGKSQLKEMP